MQYEQGQLNLRLEDALFRCCTHMKLQMVLWVVTHFVVRGKGAVKLAKRHSSKWEKSCGIRVLSVLIGSPNDP